MTMFGLNKCIEKILQKQFSKKRQSIIDEWKSNFENKYPHLPLTSELTNKIVAEVDRLYPMVDESILSTIIELAGSRFWWRASAGVLMVGFLGAFYGHSFIPFIPSLVMPVVDWVQSNTTIHIPYFKRFRGGLNSEFVRYVNATPQFKQLLESHEIKLHIRDRNSPAQHRPSLSSTSRIHKVNLQHSPTATLHIAYSAMEEGEAPTPTNLSPVNQDSLLTVETYPSSYRPL